MQKRSILLLFFWLLVNNFSICRNILNQYSKPILLQFQNLLSSVSQYPCQSKRNPCLTIEYTGMLKCLRFHFTFLLSFVAKLCISEAIAKGMQAVIVQLWRSRTRHCRRNLHSTLSQHLTVGAIYTQLQKGLMNNIFLWIKSRQVQQRIYSELFACYCP